MEKNTNIKLLIGKELEYYLEEVANLRIDIFREYPYLYDGDKEYEKNYLRKFIDTKDSLIVIAFDDEKVVGALTGLPLMFEEKEVNQP